MLNFSIKLFQKLNVNSLFLLDISFAGSLYWLTTVLINAYASSSALFAFLYSRKYAYFVNLSVMTRILLYLVPVIGSFDAGSFTMKFYAIVCYGFPSSSIGCSNLYSLCRNNLALLHTLQFLTTC
jgi:hypothetical protein